MTLRPSFVAIEMLCSAKFAATTSEDRVTRQGTPLATTADEGDTMGIARIGIATADLGSDGGVIDG